MIRGSRGRVCVGLALLGAGAVLLSASPVQPCSICRCCGPTFNALGREVLLRTASPSDSTDVFYGLALLHLIDKDSAVFASGSYRHTGENDSGHRYGSRVVANLAYEHKLGGAGLSFVFLR